MRNKIFICFFVLAPLVCIASTLEPSDIEVLRNEFDAISLKKQSTSYNLPAQTAPQKQSLNSIDALPPAQESFVDLDAVFSEEQNIKTTKRRR